MDISSRVLALVNEGVKPAPEKKGSGSGK